MERELSLASFLRQTIRPSWPRRSPPPPTQLASLPVQTKRGHAQPRSTAPPLPQPSPPPPRHLFLDSAWDQVGSASGTVVDYTELCFVANRTAVMPFVAMHLGSTFVGHPAAAYVGKGDPVWMRPPLLPADQYVVFHLPMRLHPYERALAECGGRVETAVIVRPNCSTFSEDGKSPIRYIAGPLWGASTFVCHESFAIDVEALDALPGCAVLVEWHGIRQHSPNRRAQRAKLILTSDAVRSRSRTWSLLRKRLLPDLTPHLRFFADALHWTRECMAVDGMVPSFAVMQMRLEFNHKRGNNVKLARSFNDTDVTADEANDACWAAAFKAVHRVLPPGVPIFLATDLQVDGQGSSTYSGPSKFGARPPRKTARVLANVASRSFVGRTIHSRSLPPSGSIAPTAHCGTPPLSACKNLECYFLDLALFTLADFAFTIGRDGFAQSTMVRAHHPGVVYSTKTVKWDPISHECHVEIDGLTDAAGLERGARLASRDATATPFYDRVASITGPEPRRHSWFQFDTAMPSERVVGTGRGSA